MNVQIALNIALVALAGIGLGYHLGQQQANRQWRSYLKEGWIKLGDLSKVNPE